VADHRGRDARAGRVRVLDRAVHHPGAAVPAAGRAVAAVRRVRAGRDRGGAVVAVRVLPRGGRAVRPGAVSRRPTARTGPIARGAGDGSRCSAGGRPTAWGGGT
jgi:hypothetical protein